MKKFLPALGLIIVLLLGIAPAFGQYVPPPGYYCDPNYYQCYYSAPYANPLDQFFYYGVPEIFGERERREFRERREHERYEHRRHEGRRDHPRGRD